MGEDLPYPTFCFHPLCKGVCTAAAAPPGGWVLSDRGAWAQVTMLCKLGMTKGGAAAARGQPCALLQLRRPGHPPQAAPATHRGLSAYALCSPPAVAGATGSDPALHTGPTTLLLTSPSSAVELMLCKGAPTPGLWLALVTVHSLGHQAHLGERWCVPWQRACGERGAA